MKSSLLGSCFNTCCTSWWKNLFCFRTEVLPKSNLHRLICSVSSSVSLVTTTATVKLTEYLNWARTAITYQQYGCVSFSLPNYELVYNQQYSAEGAQWLCWGWPGPPEAHPHQHCMAGSQAEVGFTSSVKRTKQTKPIQNPNIETQIQYLSNKNSAPVILIFLAFLNNFLQAFL